MRSASPIRRLAVAAGLLIAVLVACGREITGPVSAPVNVFKRFAAFAFESKVETAVPAHALRAALQQVAFERVRITLRREDGTIALDTVVLFPAGADELTLTLNVPLPASTAGSVPLSLNLGYVNAAGDTVFKGGPIPVTVTPSTSGGAPPPPVQVPVHYTGTGATATSVVIAPRTASGFPGQGTSFTAQAFAGGQVIAGTPVVFSSTNTAVVRVDATTGVATYESRGTAKVYAQLLTGPFDSATVTVTLPAARLDLVAGSGQSAPAGTTLRQRIAARVVASDGIGVGGVTVTFAATNGGTVTPASAVSASDGSVSTEWKLGPNAGVQTMTLTAPGLAGSPLTVNADAIVIAPTKLVIGAHPVNGTAGFNLAAMTVSAQDADGTVVTTFTGDVTVALGANPGTSTLGGTTTVKAVAGVATFNDLTLNRPGTGYTLVFSSASLASATSNTFAIVTGSANQLSFVAVPLFSDAVAVLAPAVRVAVQDSAGNAVTSFTGPVTLTLGPTAPARATFGGTATRNAVNGVATFDDLRLPRAGSTTLTASATGLRSATSAAITVLPGPATSLDVVLGDDQKAAAGTQLGEITVQLTDAAGNGIPDAVITFAVTSGGGSLANSTAKTDAEGKARVLWTIGAGPQTMTATYAGKLSASISATATGANLLWTGTTNTDWNTASNWTPAFAPTASDAITIPVTTNAPTIGAAASVVGLVVAPGATLTNNSTLTITGSLDAGTTITGSGSVMLAGSGTLKGVINQAVVVNGGTYTLAGPTQVTGPLAISGSGKLVLGGQALLVNGSFATAGSGRLAMSNAADLVTVTGDVVFAGGSEAGLLTAGVLNVGGNFTATGSTFTASGSHVLKMSGTASLQALAFTSPSAGQGINHLVFENGASKILSGAPQIMGDVSLLASSGPVQGEVDVKIGGDFTDATIFPDSGGNPDPQGGWRVTSTNFFGTNKMINSTFITSNVTVSGTVRLAPCTSCLSGDRFPYVLASDGYVQVNGDVTASGAGAVLKLNGNHLLVSGNFATASGGAVELKDANDYLQVYGSATFGGGSTTGKLTAGTIEVIQDFTQSGAADSFAPTVGVYTYIGVPYYGGGALRAANVLRNRAAVAPRAPSPAVAAASSRRLQQASVMRAARAERLAKLDRRAAAYARRGMAAPRRGQAVDQGRPAERGVRLLRPRRVYSGTSTISFANPTSSFFGELYLAGPAFVLASDVQVAGELETGVSASFSVSSSSATPRKLTSHGADVLNLTFVNVSWLLLDGSSVWSMDYVAFDNMDPTVDQFTIARTSDELGASCECSEYELSNWAFSTTPTTGKYIRATDTNGGPNVTTVLMTSPYPSSHGGKVATAGGAVIANWPETSVVSWDGSASTVWSDTANWSGGVVPTSLDDVLIPSSSANNPYLSATAYAHHLTIETGKRIDTSCNELYVYGNVVAPLGSAAVITCEGDAIHLVGDGQPFNTVVGNFDVVTVEGNYRVAGPGSQLIVNDQLHIDGGNLTINGGRVDVGGLGGINYATFRTANGGTLTMTNPADQMFVGGGGARFFGGSTTGLLTAGTLTLVEGGLFTADPLSFPGASLSGFSASGTHLVVFSGYNSVNFFNPALSSMANAQLPGGATMFLNSNAVVTGTLSRGTGAGVTSVATNAYPSLSRLLTVNGLNQSGADAMQFTNVPLTLTGSSAVTFNTAAFAGYGPGFAGEAVFEVNRSSGALTFTGLDFSTAGFGADTTRHYVKNSGTSNITLTGATPSPGIPGMHFIAVGAGTVTWP